MNASFRIAATALVAACGLTAAHAADISIDVGLPGGYGQLDLGGGYPPPQLVYGQPVVIERGPPGEPLYLHVPPGQERDWRRYCRQYGACGRPVYFVRDDWFRTVYAPRYREFHGGGDRRGPERRFEGEGPRGGDGDRGRGGRDGPRGEEHRGNERREDERR